MSSPYVGEIRMFGGNFAPAGWAFCDGSAQPVSQNETLFDLIGATYGGEGDTFNLPDLRNRVPVHQGQGPGLTQNYAIGATGGVEQVTLSLQQMPTHNHDMNASDNNGQQPQPTNAYLAKVTPGDAYVAALATSAQLQLSSIGPVGGGQPHENMAPSLGLTFIISLFGIYPSPN